MATEIGKDAVVRYLVEFWRASVPNIGEYLRNQFGLSLDTGFQFKRLFICEMADATVSTGNIGGMYARKWVLLNDILESVALNYAYKEMYEMDTSGKVYLSPSFLYGRDADAVLLSERYGPSLKHRRRGRILAGGGQLTGIEWDTLWCDRV